MWDRYVIFYLLPPYTHRADTRAWDGEAGRRGVVSSPEWSIGLFDCCDDGAVCALSATCTFCVFGWNMERLGFGNMYVHAFTFILLCVAPLLIFSVTVLNIHDDEIRDTVVGVGVLLGFCGFLYGGFWRSQMRKRYKLPGGRCAWWWCGSAAVADCAKWLFCWTWRRGRRLLARREGAERDCE